MKAIKTNYGLQNVQLSQKAMHFFLKKVMHCTIIVIRASIKTTVLSCYYKTNHNLNNQKQKVILAWFM
jgi:hypothetical protein